MKIWHLTDLHLNFGKLKIKKYPTADVVVLNGDISNKLASWLFIETLLEKGYKVILILGNHEYYNSSNKNISTMQEIEKKWKEKEEKTKNFHVLINETLVIDNIRFIGTTLWSDFLDKNSESMKDFNEEMSDSKRIYKSYKGSNYSRRGGININAEDVYNLHLESKKFLINELKKDFSGKTIVLSHHAPSFKSIAENFKGSITNGSFASNLEDIIEKYQIYIWFHGHVHHKVNYYLYKTLIHCNPRGYLMENELNLEFDLNNVIEVN